MAKFGVRLLCAELKKIEFSATKLGVRLLCECADYASKYGICSSVRKMLLLLLQVEKKRQEAKMSRDRLHDSLLELVDKQRLYFRTVKEFKEECRKNEVLVGKLKESSGKQR